MISLDVSPLYNHALTLVTGHIEPFVTFAAEVVGALSNFVDLPEVRRSIGSPAD